MNVFSKIYTQVLREELYKVTNQAVKQKKTDLKSLESTLKQHISTIRSTMLSMIESENTPEVQAVKTNKTGVAKHKALYDIPRVKEIVDLITQDRQQPQSVTKYIIEYILQRYPIDPNKKGNRGVSIESYLIGKAENNFRESVKTTSADASFEGSGYAEDFKKFFPPTVTFELSPTRAVNRFIEVYGNLEMTIQEKCNRTAYIIKNQDDIVNTIMSDIGSNDEIKKLCALEAGLMFSTGIRPGIKVGIVKMKDLNGEVVRDPDTNKPKETNSYGATTLLPEHLNFVGDNVLKLHFVGKMGSHNYATITDNTPLNKLLLRDMKILYARASDPSSFLFTTRDGIHVAYNPYFSKYFEQNWGELKPTDFRKQIAAKTLYENLQINVKKMYDTYQQMKVNGVAEIKNDLVNKITEMLNNAVAEVRTKLNHEEDSSTAIDDYINPKLIIHFLNTANLDATYENILINNVGVELTFDVNAFIKYADQYKG